MKSSKSNNGAKWSFSMDFEDVDLDKVTDIAVLQNLETMARFVSL